MIVAGFATEQALEHAVTAMRRERLSFETYTSGELHKAGADSTISPLPLVMAASGVAAGIGMFLLQVYADVFAYPIDVGGRPDFSWPAFIVNAFEVGVLCAMLAGLLGYFVLNRMPALYDPVDECDGLRRGEPRRLVPRRARRRAGEDARAARPPRPDHVAGTRRVKALALLLASALLLAGCDDMTNQRKKKSVARFGRRSCPRAARHGALARTPP